MNIRPDYSMLFSSMSNTGKNSSSSFGAGSFFTDYASIKNGSYGKLMKAYYGKTGSADKIVGDTPFGKDQDSKKELTSVKNKSDALKDSADALISKGKDSVFNQKDITIKNEDGTTTTEKGYDTEAIYKNVKDLVDNYNSLVKTASESSNTTVARQTASLVNTMKSYASSLSKMGITLDKENKLTINEDTFKKSDMGAAKTLFNGNQSLSFQVSAKASMVNYTATRALDKSNTYQMNGNFNTFNSSGNAFNDYI